jgi:RHS repeat-associated protein
VYSTFGAVIVSTGATTNPFGYKGALSYYKDTLSGDLYVRSRTYRPTLGRWLSIDPLAPSVHDLYRYTYNAPLMFSDASGLVPEKDDSDNKEEMEKCSQEEQDWWFIEEACDCIWYRVTQERFEEHSGAGWIASVTCENDQMVIMYNTDPTITKLLEEYKKCGFDKCVARHESHHIAQCNLTNSMVCKGVQPPEPGYVVYVTVTPNCTKKAECFAYLTEARCALDIFKKLQMDGRTECMEIARKFIGRVEGQLRHFECHVSDDLKKELSDAWDQANEGSKMK